jgi:hypothetical protein
MGIRMRNSPSIKKTRLGSGHSIVIDAVAIALAILGPPSASASSVTYDYTENGFTIFPMGPTPHPTA